MMEDLCERMSILGIRVGATQVRAGRVDAHGRLCSSRSDRMFGDADALATALHYIVAAGEPPEGIGITCDGADNPLRERVAAMIRPALSADAPIHTEEAGRAALIAETVWGGARGRSNVVLLTLGARVSGAVMVDGRVLRGATGAAGCLAHLPVDPAGPLCACGARGCMEALVSTRAIEAEALAAVRRGCEWRRKGKPGEVTWQAILEAEQDPVAGAVVQRAVRALETALAALARLYDPEVVLLGGELAGHLPAPASPVAVESACLKDPSGVLAAASLVMNARNGAAGAQ